MHTHTSFVEARVHFLNHFSFLGNEANKLWNCSIRFGSLNPIRFEQTARTHAHDSLYQWTLQKATASRPVPPAPEAWTAYPQKTCWENFSCPPGPCPVKWNETSIVCLVGRSISFHWFLCFSLLFIFEAIEAHEFFNLQPPACNWVENSVWPSDFLADRKSSSTRFP